MANYFAAEIMRCGVTTEEESTGKEHIIEQDSLGITYPFLYSRNREIGIQEMLII